MKRKIVKTGQNTLIVSLPSTWVKKYHLEKGQFLELEENAGVLKIYPVEKAKKSLKIILKDEGYWYINRILRRIYAAGYSKIEIAYSKPEQINYIRKSVSFLDGFEVIQSKNNSCILKNILKPEELNYRDLLEDIMWLIHSQLEIFKNSLSKGSTKDLKEIGGINNTLIKLAHLGRRILNIDCKQDVVILKDSFLLFTNLLYLSAYLNYASEELLKKGVSLSPSEKELITETHKMYETLLYAYRNKDLQEIQNFFQKRNDTFERDNQLLEGENPKIIHFILNFRKEMGTIGNYFLSMSFEEKLNS
jgi:phosphate uptake regulator